MRAKIIHWGEDYAKLLVGTEEFEIGLGLAKAIENQQLPNIQPRDYGGKMPSVEYRTIAFYTHLCTECGSPNTIVYKHPHRYAGIWECVDCGASDSCEHEEVRNDTETVDTMRNGEHDQYETPVIVCELCEVSWPDDREPGDD